MAHPSRRRAAAAYRGPSAPPRLIRCGTTRPSQIRAASPFGSNIGFFAFANECYRKPNLYADVRERFAALDNVYVVKGVVPDVLAERSPERIAYLHIDLNSPAAELGALEMLFDRVVPGSMIVFDDYGWRVFIQQKIAEDAFMRCRGYAILELPTGQGLVVKR